MDFIKNIISEYGLLAMFLIIMLEYACFPVSSEIVLPFSGAVASASHINFFVILPVSVLAGLIGTGICYTVGWFGGGAILNAIARKFPKSKKGLDSANERFKDHGASAVCLGRMIPLIRTYIAFIAGGARLNPITYFAASALGITAWNTLLIGLGYILRENYKTVAECYVRYKHYLLPALIIFTVILTANLIFKRRKKKAAMQNV